MHFHYVNSLAILAILLTLRSVLVVFHLLSIQLPISAFVSAVMLATALLVIPVILLCVWVVREACN